MRGLHGLVAIAAVAAVAIAEVTAAVEAIVRGLMERFEQHSVSFVSVTQEFNLQTTAWTFHA